MPSRESDGPSRANTAKTPAFVPLNQNPPRNNAPGMLRKAPVSPALPVVPGPPKQLKSPPAIPVWLVQSVQLIALSAQSATHSQTFPTMSNTRHLDWQFDREPALTALPPAGMMPSPVPFAVPATRAPAAAS